MDAYISQFCSVLRAGLWNSAPEVKLTGADMRKIWTDAQKQAVTGLVAQGFLNTGRIAPKTVEMLQNKLLSIAAMNFKQSHLLADSVRALEAGGVHPILLKGLGVASYYHQPLLRESGDIDLYVDTNDYRKSYDILSDSLADIEEKEFHPEEKHSHIVVHGVPIELHQYSDQMPQKYDVRFQEISDKALAGDYVMLPVDDVVVSTPEPTFNVFYVFNHFWRHFIAVGVGFRQICDWAVLLHAYKDKINNERLADYLESFDLMKPWMVFGYLAVNYLGLSENEMPFYDPSFKGMADKVIGMVMKEGNFGHERESRWKESGHRFLDTTKVFALSSLRYLKMATMFGGLAWQEYKMRINSYLCRPKT